MFNAGKSKLELEVLISTTHKTSLDFLNAIFCNCDTSNFKILIINQSNHKVDLCSNKSNIRVINVPHFGLSKSRNLALKFAQGDICLFSDDDVVYNTNFDRTIVQAFEEYPNAGLIGFKIHDLQGLNYRNYSAKNEKFNLKSVKQLMSIEIAVKRKIILDNNVKFDERFGLGAQFETGEEYLFSRSVLKQDIPAYFFNAFIVYHEEFNSGKDLGSDKIVYARAALNYNLYNKFAYLWMFKYIVFLLKHKLITYNQVINKLKVAKSGIKAIKKTISYE